MSANPHKSVRLGSEELQAVAREMAAGNANESESIRRLLRRGAGLPEPVYLKAQISCRGQLEVFAAQMLAWRTDFANVRSRLAIVVPDPADTERTELVRRWRELATRLEKEALTLATVADALAHKMMGLSTEECAVLVEGQRSMLGTAKRLKGELESSELTAEMRASKERSLRFYESANKVLANLLG